MKKNGFTLIELLAVILILGIIALIAIPTVTNIIKESKRGAFKSSVQNLISAVETECQLEQMRGEDLTTSYILTNGKVDNELNIKGDLPSSGTITVDSSCNLVVDVTDGTFNAIKSLQSDEILIVEGASASVSFAEDSWETIVANVKRGNVSTYKVGDTKEIALTGDVAGTYKVRIANISTPEECNTELFSQTSCGFVIEFEDIISEHGMNLTNSNVGGWEASKMRSYVNDTIYNALPTDLKKSILTTKVVSGHGTTDGETNFVTIDKLFLLSAKELWGKEGTSDIVNYDSAEVETRQLDYYKTQGIRTDNYTGAIKKYNGEANYWWLRTANSVSVYSFYRVGKNGNSDTNHAEYERGVAPAFRIG